MSISDSPTDMRIFTIAIAGFTVFLHIHFTSFEDA